jgi:hypothetical protein
VHDASQIPALGYPLDHHTVALRAVLRNNGYYVHPATTRAYFMEAHTFDEVERCAAVIEAYLLSNRNRL